VVEKHFQTSQSKAGGGEGESENMGCFFEKNTLFFVFPKISTTLTPEHGPFPYQHVLPHSNQPIADIFEINTWIGERQQANYKRV
jgi:hypothetical protein